METLVAYHDELGSKRNPSRITGIIDRGTVAYVQDYEGLDWIANPNRAKVEMRDNVRGYGSPERSVGADSLLAHYALLWPAHMQQFNCYSPAVTGAAAAFFVVPAFETDVAIGAALLFGYAVGAATFYIVNQNEMAARVAIREHKAEGSEMRQMMSVQRFDPGPLFIENPNPQQLRDGTLSEGPLQTSL